MPSKNLTFDVRYTESGTLVPVDDPLQLRITEQLDSEMCTVSDISAVTDVPASTLYLAMNKMAASGLISKCTDGGKRNAKYQSSSMSIMNSCEAMEMPSFEWMLDNSRKETESFLAMFNMFHRMGLNLNPVMQSFGRRLALTDGFIRTYGNLTAEEFIVGFGQYLRDNNLGNAELESFVPFRVRMTSPVEIRDIYEPVVYIIMGFIKQMLSTITDHDISISSLEQTVGDSGTEWYVDFIFGNGSAKNLDVYQMNPECDTARFLIVKPKDGGMVRLITNPTELRIMESVNERRIRLCDVSRLAGVTKSTASMYVNKLIKEGFLTSDTDSGTIYISSMYSIILHRNRPVSGKVADLMDLMGDVTDFNSMVDNMMRFFSGSLKFLGYDTHYIMEELGMIVADRLYATRRDASILDMMNSFVSRLKSKGSRMRVESLTPLSISYAVPSRNNIKVNATYYHNGFLRRMLELMCSETVSACHESHDSGDTLTITYTFMSGPDPSGGTV